MHEMEVGPVGQHRRDQVSLAATSGDRTTLHRLLEDTKSMLG